MHNAIDNHSLEEWEVIACKTEIERYLPSENSVRISLGSDQEVQLKSLEKHTIPDKKKKGSGAVHIINTGGSIWALDFIPKTNSRPIQYLALGGYKSTTEQHILGDITKYPNSIQIWSFDGNDSNSEPRLDMCILHEFGIISDIQWCPKNHYVERKKLGILAVVLGDGSVYILMIPHPEKIRRDKGFDFDSTVYVQVKKPHLLLTLPRVYTTCISWSKEFLACGTLSGHVVVWDVAQSLLLQTPTLHIQIPHVDRKPIRSIAWTPPKEPYTILSMDISGQIYVHDLRDPFYGHQTLRLRSVYSPLLGVDLSPPSFFYGGHDGTCRLNAGIYFKHSSTAIAPGYGTVWSLSFCTLCRTLASGMSTGEVMARQCLDSKGQLTKLKKKEVGLLYQLSYNKGSFCYTEGDENYSHTDRQDFQRMLTDPVVAIHKIAWNQNKNFCNWIASGGKAGLCRLEFFG
ncbi:WD40-repeat-containing domain protein [Sporodiniella umbellata]|nr:WD40-repeat-containing domain protein [Sporodiniella umbellata]